MTGIGSRLWRDFPPVQTGPGDHPASCKMGKGSFPGVKCARGVLLTTHQLLVPWSWKSRAIPLPTLWGTPGMYRVHFTFTLVYIAYKAWYPLVIFTSDYSADMRRLTTGIRSQQWRTEGGLGGSTPSPIPKFRRPSKIVPNSTRLWKLLKKTAEFRTPTPQDVRKKGSKILKLPLVRNCFTLAMTNKLVVIINSLKVPNIKENFTT